MLAHIETTLALTQASVVATAGSQLILQSAEGRFSATLALQYFYQPVEGDRVLAIGQADSWYVIGVLEGNGPMVLTAAGDLEIRAPHGCIQMASSRGIRLSSPDIRLIGDRLAMVARAISERCAMASRWVQGTCRLQAGSVGTVVRSSFKLRAEKIVQRAEADVKINGRAIHLG